MVNYKRVVCEVAVLLVVLTVAAAAPADIERHYDQRQNGTENYRLNIDGVVIAIAPAESLLAAASDFDISTILQIEDFEEFQKPKPPASGSHSKPEDEHEESKPTDLSTSSESKPESSSSSDLKTKRKAPLLRKQEKTQRLKQQLVHALMPLLRRNRHH